MAEVEAELEERGSPPVDPERRVQILFGFLGNLHGADRIVLKARKLGALRWMRSPRVGERLLALQRLVFEDPTLQEVPSRERWPEVFGVLEEEIANLVARREVEDRLDQRIAVKMRERHLDYLKDLRREAFKEAAGPETSATLRRLAELEELEGRGLEASALTLLRPGSLDEVVGQRQAIESLISKVGTPYPQHVLAYGPPGVGKTTVARLVLELVKGLPTTPFQPDAPFVEVDATTVRWDPREVTNPLLGSVHDPIYQGSRRELAEDGIPEPKLGLVTRAHGGVLFLDEVGELDPILLNKLLKVLEDKRVSFESSYFDEDDPRVPAYIKRLFTLGAPADFILIGATTRSPEEIPLALRSRCAELFFEPLSREHVARIVEQAALRLGVELEAGVAEQVSRYTIEGRKAVQILTDAFGVACAGSTCSAGHLGPGPIRLGREHLERVVQDNRLTSSSSARIPQDPEIGRVYGLGVSGFLGSCLEFEAACHPCREPGKGQLRFNEAAGDSARDSVFNARSVIRRLLDKDLGDHDVHVNVVGGGRIDGPSAGLAVTLALVSALEGRAPRPDLAVTGEVSIQGKVKPVGGIPEKLQGARRAGIRKVLIPWENRDEVPSAASDLEIVAVATVAEALTHLYDLDPIRPGEAGSRQGGGGAA